MCIIHLWLVGYPASRFSQRQYIYIYEEACGFSSRLTVSNSVSPDWHDKEKIETVFTVVRICNVKIISIRNAVSRTEHYTDISYPTGIVSILYGVAIWVTDFWYPAVAADFFGIDVLQDSEEFYHKEKEPEGILTFKKNPYYIEWTLLKHTKPYYFQLPGKKKTHQRIMLEEALPDGYVAFSYDIYKQYSCVLWRYNVFQCDDECVAMSQYSSWIQYVRDYTIKHISYL